MWLGATTRAPPMRDARAFRARGRLSFPRSVTRALGGFVAFGPSGTEHRPLPPGARKDDPSGAAGTFQAGVCGDAAGPGGRPARAGLRIKRRRSTTRRSPDRSGHSRWICPCRNPPRSGGPRADRGLASQASGPRVRSPPTGTHRLPPARAPSAPAIRSGRKVGQVWHGWEGCGKNCGDHSRLGDVCAAHWLARPWPGPAATMRRAAGRRAVQAVGPVSVCAEWCSRFLAPSCSRRIATLRRLALKPTSNRSPITGTRPIT